MALKTHAHLVATQASLYFQYTFMFSRFSFEDIGTTSASGQEDPKPLASFCKAVSLILNEALPKNDECNRTIKVYPHWGEEGGNPCATGGNDDKPHSCIKPLVFIRSPHLTVEREMDTSEDRFSVILPPPSSANQSAPIKINVSQLKQRVVLFENGTGICEIQMDIHNLSGAISRDELLEMVRLAQIRDDQTDSGAEQNKVSTGSLMLKDDKRIIYDFFYSLVRNFADVLAIERPEVFGPDPWIEVREKLVAPLTDRTTCYHRNVQYFQDPFVTLIATVPDTIYNCFLYSDESEPALDFAKVGPTEEKKRIHRDLAAMLLLGSRETSAFLDTGYIEDQFSATDGILRNMGANSRFFVQLNTRIAVAVISESNPDIRPEVIDGWIRTLIRCINMLRMRWYSLVVADDRLDKLLREVYRDYGNMKKPQDVKLLETKIVTCKVDLLGTLEDPITLQTSSGSALHIYDVGYHHLRIREVQGLVAIKLEQLDQLFTLVRSSTLLDYASARNLPIRKAKIFYGTMVAVTCTYAFAFFLAKIVNAVMPSCPVPEFLVGTTGKVFVYIAIFLGCLAIWLGRTAARKDRK